MTLLDFDQEVKRSAFMEVLGANDDSTAVFVKVQFPKPEGQEVEDRIAAIPLADIQRMPKDLFSGWVFGRPILTHMTRIVGYYSIVNKSWNRSKLAELKDRQIGDYTQP